MKDKKFTILCIILIILLTAFAVYMVLQQDRSPVGTFHAKDTEGAEDIYLSVTADQGFQIEIRSGDKAHVLQGTYTEEPDGKNLRLLLTCTNGSTATAMFDHRGQIFLDGSSLPDMPQKILAFGRINDVPGRVGHQ